MSTGRVLHFTVGDRRFALSFSDILEITEVSGLTPVPGCPTILAGIVDIRGRIVTLIDLGEIYGNSSPPESCLAVQLSEPFAHLGVLVPGRVQEVESEETAEESWVADGDNVADGDSVADGSDGAGEDLVPDQDPSALGREVLLSGARPAFLIDVEALSEYCTIRVRKRFRVGA